MFGRAIKLAPYIAKLIIYPSTHHSCTYVLCYCILARMACIKSQFMCMTTLLSLMLMQRMSRTMNYALLSDVLLRDTGLEICKWDWHVSCSIYLRMILQGVSETLVSQYGGETLVSQADATQSIWQRCAGTKHVHCVHYVNYVDYVHYAQYIHYIH